MVFDIRYVWTSLEGGIRYIPTTLALSIVPLLVGIFFGLLIALARRFQVPLIGTLTDILIPVVKGIPMVLHLFILNFLVLKPLDLLAGQYAWADRLRFMDKIYIGMAALSIYAVIAISETMRSALFSVDNGQYEACYSVGLTRGQALVRVILPQAFPVAVPVLCNNFIGLIKSSSIVYLITVMDVLNGALASAQISYRFLEAYIAAALIYWALCASVEKLSYVLEKRLKSYKNREAL